MRRRAALFTCLLFTLSLTSCGIAGEPQTTEASFRPDPSTNVEPDRCADAKLERNMTPEEFATAAARYEISLTGGDPDRPAHQEQIRTSETIALQSFGPLVSATPPDGQRNYARAVCALASRDFPLNRLDLPTSLLVPGYSGCASAQAMLEAQSNGPPLELPTKDDSSVALIVAQAALNRALMEISNLGRDQAVQVHKFLCPQIPMHATTSSGPQFCEKEVQLSESGAPGLVLVARGSVDCDSARRIIPESVEALAEEQARFGYYTYAGLRYVCAGLSAAESEEEGYGYECRTEDDRIVIIWKLDAE